jgi:hypothetical protein
LKGENNKNHRRLPNTGESFSKYQRISERLAGKDPQTSKGKCLQDAPKKVAKCKKYAKTAETSANTSYCVQKSNFKFM